MTKASGHRDSLDGYLHDLDVRIARQERHSHHGVGAVGGGAAMFLSADRNNDTIPGYDAGAYTREVVAQAATPTAADFGGHLRPGCVWVEIGGDAGSDCITFSDDFERADGPLGPDWTAGHVRDTSFDSGMVTITPSIVSGRVEGGEDNDVSILLNDVMSTHATPGDQFVEIVVDNYHQGYVLGGPQFQIVEGQFVLYCQANDTDLSLTGVMLEFYVTDLGSGPFATLYGVTFTQDASGVSTGGAEAGLDGVGWPDDSAKTLRLEVSEAGHVRVTADGAVVVETDFPPLSGDHVGFAFRWHNTSYTASPPSGTGTSFWVLEAAGGCLETTPAPLIEGEEGVGLLNAWTGSAWQEGPAYGWDGTTWIPAIAVHGWDGSAWVTAGT